MVLGDEVILEVDEGVLKEGFKSGALADEVEEVLEVVHHFVDDVEVPFSREEPLCKDKYSLRAALCLTVSIANYSTL